MLHVAFLELPRSRAQQVGAGDLGANGGQRHAVLQLVPEAVGPAGLIERRARPDAAGERLVQEPAIQHEIHRARWRAHPQRAQHAIPELRDTGQHGVQIRCAVLGQQGAGLIGSAGLAQQHGHFNLTICRHNDVGAQCAAGVEPGAGRARQLRAAGQRRRISPTSSKRWISAVASVFLTVRKNRLCRMRMLRLQSVKWKG